VFQLLFPQYKRRKWAYLPLGILALQEVKTLPDGSVHNPLLDATYCRKWISRLHRRYRASCSYGGWFEDRGILWRGHYMQEGQTTHLGVDLTVPIYSRTYSPSDGTVVEVWEDKDVNGGWGGRIIIKVKPRLFVILAHFGKMAVKEGQTVKTGDYLGSVGSPKQNGNWFPHLHVQIVRGSYKNIDGYGSFDPKTQRKFPDPMQFWPTYAGRLDTKHGNDSSAGDI
jgi:murein DD-endopeptidase MepM/ murein hydrolase activator NlpD